MWSGPRNISTAMMYAFGNRADCVAWDEPFYGFSLVNHGNDHPMRDEIIAANESDWDTLVARCTAPAAKPVFYQKHMTHHMLPGFDRSWIHKLTNAFLIRSPERVLASYTKNGRMFPCAISALSNRRRFSTWWRKSWACPAGDRCRRCAGRIRAAFSQPLHGLRHFI